eukprot:scaffold7348_cov113-Isochrysis_galbana.AAC.5
MRRQHTPRGPPPASARVRLGCLGGTHGVDVAGARRGETVVPPRPAQLRAVAFHPALALRVAARVVSV